MWGPSLKVICLLFVIVVLLGFFFACFFVCLGGGGGSDRGQGGNQGETVQEPLSSTVSTQQQDHLSLSKDLMDTKLFLFR